MGEHQCIDKEECAIVQVLTSVGNLHVYFRDFHVRRRRFTVLVGMAGRRRGGDGRVRFRRRCTLTEAEGQRLVSPGPAPAGTTLTPFAIVRTGIVSSVQVGQRRARADRLRIIDVLRGAADTFSRYVLFWSVLITKRFFNPIKRYRGIDIFQLDCYTIEYLSKQITLN